MGSLTQSSQMVAVVTGGMSPGCCLMEHHFRIACTLPLQLPILLHHPEVEKHRPSRILAEAVFTSENRYAARILVDAGAASQRRYGQRLRVIDGFPRSRTFGARLWYSSTQWPVPL